uniref:Bifunctional inhibitor/plant lipid transfer protein/seed storage helical domain-containing protein n=1 Tax=Oryza brachyantha TaxID=4533 RepID=J3L3D6_ORYBR
MARRAAATKPVALACAAVVLLVLAAAMTLAPAVEAGQNCICECVKLCMRTRIPSIEAQCVGKCRETACVHSCEEACERTGFPKLPAEGIGACELEPLTPDEEHMLH